MIYTPRQQSLVILITTALLTTLAGAATLTLFMPESQAQMRSLSEVSIKLVVANPAIESSDKGTAADGNARRLKHAEITRLIAKSIERDSPLPASSNLTSKRSSMESSSSPLTR